MHRRQALRLLAASAALSPKELLALGQEAHARSAASAGLRVLNRSTEHTLASTTEGILPGAMDAEVTRFIDVMLADWYPADERDRFLEGIQELEERKFTDATLDDRTAILTELDAAAAESTDEHWFATLKFLTIWGYFTSEVGSRALRAQSRPGRYQGCVKRS